MRRGSFVAFNFPTKINQTTLKAKTIQFFQYLTLNNKILNVTATFIFYWPKHLDTF